MKTKDEILKDDFLRNLMPQIEMQTSVDFTSMVMHKVQVAEVAKLQRIQRWRQLKIILMIAAALSTIIYVLVLVDIVFPYLSIWLPSLQQLLHYVSTFAVVVERILFSYFKETAKYSILAISLLFAAIAWRKATYQYNSVVE